MTKIYNTHDYGEKIKIIKIIIKKKKGVKLVILTLVEVKFG